MKIVRSVRLRPDQYKRHWEDYGISLRSGHIRDTLDFADNAVRLLERIRDEAEHETDLGDNYIGSYAIEEEIYFEVKRLLEEAEHGRA